MAMKKISLSANKSISRCLIEIIYTRLNVIHTNQPHIIDLINNIMKRSKRSVSKSKKNE